MAKRKSPDTIDEVLETPSKRMRKTSTKALDPNDHKQQHAGVKARSTPSKSNTTPLKSKDPANGTLVNGDDNRSGSPTPVPNGKTLFATPTKNKSIQQTPSKTKRADQSAKRKSAHRLAQVQDENDWDDEDALAQEILDEEGDTEEALPNDEAEDIGETEAETPSKRGRGRPKGAKNKREPTPEGDIPPEERYFFQNRSGPPQYSNNQFSQVKLLTHDDYFEQIRRHKESHEDEKRYLMKLHARSFPQWKFELSEGYSLCLYGYGSKRQLTNKFAQWLYERSKPRPQIVIVNGYTPKLSIRNILGTIGSALVGEDEELKLSGQPQEMLDTLLKHLTSHPPPGQLLVIINSIDSQALRKSSVQAILARLASHPLVTVLATADTPTFPLLWNSSLLDQFSFAFHDCTTFAPYSAEISVVDDVYDLLGRKGRRIGGQEGVGFVLKSLPPNARNLYRILLAEILSILSEDMDTMQDDDEDAPRARQNNESAEEVGVEYRLLYQKASEEFICSSDMNFRFLLKEFHDHQMITSRRDASGTELLCVPLGRDEMQAVLEDLLMS